MTELAPTQIFLDGKVELRPGDCRDVIKAMPDNSIDSVVCDPPYALVSIVKRFGGPNAAAVKVPEDGSGAYARASSGFMGKQWDTGETAFATEFWTEVLRVLKPGGHVVAFSGTRTYHRMAVAIEDSGFEIRDQLAWCYGSGFPKSHDVSKGIDKAAGAVRKTVRDYNPRNPKATGGGKDGMEGATRPWIEAAMELGYHEKAGNEPATDAAREWQGWGTALKPAWEPICLARKPLMSVAIDVLENIERAMRERGVEGEIIWTKEPASDAAKQSRTENSSLTEAPQAEVIYVKNAAVSGTVSGETQIEICSERQPTIGLRQTESGSAKKQENQTQNCESKFSTPTADNVSVAESESEPSSRSTISTAEEPHIERLYTAKSTLNCAGRVIQPGTEFFAGIATGLTGSQAHVHISKNTDGSFVWPEGLPKRLEAKSLTVAANVLEHGTGALNIDGCRVGTEERVNPPAHNVDGSGWGMRPNVPASTVSGRWPANIVHDGSDEVLAGFPDTKSGMMKAGTVRAAQDAPGSVVYGVYGGNAANADTFGDSGSAARFFYTAKADKLDRIGSKHPTVKPVDLMQWLCRMVTPPGGTILDPFAGSGSTGEAAWREGFRCILIEREEEYQADIAARLNLADKGPATRKARAIKQVEGFGPLFGDNDNDNGGAEPYTASSRIKTRNGDGGIMAGKGGFGFRIRDQQAKEHANG